MNTLMTNEKIAIIGLSCLFPGSNSLDEFWQNLINGVNSTSLATSSQFGADPNLYYDAQRRTHDTTYSLRGGYVQADIEIPQGMDKAAAWSLHVVREALKHSGYAYQASVLARCGLIMGNLSFPTQKSHQLIAPIYDAALESAIGELLGQAGFQLYREHAADGSYHALNSPAAVVAQSLQLGGVNFCLDAACASSLYAVALACAYLLSGKTDLMLAGAVSAADPLFVNMGFTHFGAYPDKGDSQPLDANSNGLISGEGAGMLVLKRYSDAVRDGDQIYAVVGGIGLSNDGRGKHPLTPNPRGQITAFQRAYASGVSPESVQYVECHASGTPLGDKTELNSMDEFFGGRGVTPLIGSVKANHGHLLTVAGVSSLIKVILSMQHGEIPATIGINDPLTTQHFSPAQIVRQNTSWPQSAKTAGVNAFGFGGVSAHLVLQNHEAASQTQTQSVDFGQTPAKMAIVGMDMQFGDCDGLEDFAQTLYDGTQHFRDLPPKRWKGLSEDAPQGAYIESFEIDFLRFKFPPKEDDQPTPQHLLLLKVADNAVRDAGLQEGSNVAVIVALGTELSLHQYRSRLDLTWQMKESVRRAGLDLAEDEDYLESVVKDAISPPAQVNQYTSYIGNIVSSRVSALWDFSGPAFTTYSGENSVYKALEVAQILLANDALDAVVIGAVDLAGGIENVTLRREQNPVNTGAATMSFDQQANGWQVGEGAGAVVLRRADKVKAQRVYAMIEGLAVMPYTDPASIQETILAALSASEITPEVVSYVEASASGVFIQDSAEIAGLNAVYAFENSQTDEVPKTALSSVKANIGHTGAASGIASLIKTALCLYERFIPATPNWSAPKLPELWDRSMFYVAGESRTWFSPNGENRYGTVSGFGEDGTYAHVVLSDAVVMRDHSSFANHYLQQKPFYLFPVDADNQAELIARLGQLEADFQSGAALQNVAQKTFAAFRNGRYAAVMVGHDRANLLREIQMASKGIPQAFEKVDDWQTPSGSFFTANPLGSKGGVAFVYPGAFNSYPQLGQNWLHLFPSAHDHLMTLTSNPGEKIADTVLYPRSLAKPGRAEIKASRAKLADNQVAMMESGTTFAVLFTQVMRQVFKLKPDAALGYSIGEGSMLWAMDAWHEGDAASEVFNASNLFKSRLFGRKEAIREAWGLPSQFSDDFWASYVLTTSFAQVMDAISHETHVYLTHVNTPTEVVIAGDPAACERVIEKIGCQSLRAPFEVAIHNEAMLSEYNEFYRLHHWPVQTVSQNVTFYSAADYEPIRMESDLIARSIGRVSCKYVDFPRLVHRAYRDGARIFVELGPGATCTRWINDTLKSAGREHLAVAIDNLRLDDHSALIKMLARLASHRVSMDLSPLYQLDRPVTNAKGLLRTITLGGEPVREMILTEENKRRFGRTVGNNVVAESQQPAMYNERMAEPEMELQTEIGSVATGDHDYSSRLQQRLGGLREFEAALRAQIQNPNAAGLNIPAADISEQPSQQMVKPEARYTPSPAIFDTYKIDQFARGSIQACFGPEYAAYDHKRAPRIPNTDLMLVSRFVEVDATRLVTKVGSSMVAEYDVPVDMWFFEDNSYPFTPYSMLMEMALQPCGFLSAFMGPTLDFPDIDFYFRNLDGQGKLLRDVDLRGRTLANRVVLTSSTILQGIIIQKYTFDMMLDGESFYVGNSTFGYFTLQALSSQAGLDMGKPPLKWHVANPDAQIANMMGNRQSSGYDGQNYMTLPVDQLAFLDAIKIDVQGGKSGLGYVYATSHVDPSDWFFKCHFHQDPVMPGSLGLEAIVQAVQAFAIRAELGREFTTPRFGHVADQTMVWKYRGQVLNDSREVNVEVHITKIERVGQQIHILADASLWKGELRIYEFKNVAVSITDEN